MLKKFLDWQYDIMVLCGIITAIRFIYTKEIYIEVNGYTVNTLTLLIYTIINVGIYRSWIRRQISNNSIKNEDDVETK